MGSKIELIEQILPLMWKSDQVFNVWQYGLFFKKNNCGSFWCIPTFWYIQLTYGHFRQAFSQQVTTDFFFLNERKIYFAFIESNYTWSIF